MLKPESEDGKSTKGSSSSSWVNCLVMTLLVISLTMAVAALWIPWERLNKLDRMTRENKDNFEQLQRLILQINGTSPSDSLSAKAELLKSASLELERDIVKENDNLHEMVADIEDKLEHNEKEYNSLLKSQKLMQEKLEQFQKLYEERVKEEGKESKQTGDVLKQVRELSLKLNELEAKSRTTEITSEANEATILKVNDKMASLEKELRNLSIDEIGLEGKSNSFVMEEITKLENYTRQGIAEIQQGTFEMVQSNQIALETRVAEFASNAETKMGICRDEVKEKIAQFENSKENIESKIEDVDDKLEKIQKNFNALIKQKDLGDNVENLQSRVNNITNKMNLFVQNVLMVKNTQNMVNDIQKRIDFLEKQRLA